MKTINKKIIVIAIMVLMVTLLVPGLPVTADEVSTGAEVSVSDDTIYGFKNIDSHDVVLDHYALKAPDGAGAYIFLHGWIIIEFKSMVAQSSMISYWAANGGLQKSNIKVYISKDKKKWTYIDQRTIKDRDYKRYDITGDFKNVRYIKISRNAGLFSWLELDAVGVRRE